MNKISKKITMKNYFKMPVLAALFLFFMICACEEEEDEILGNWIERSDFEGKTRSSSVAFTIGDKAYVGTGFNGSDDEYYVDFWRYDAQMNYWQKISDFPGTARSSAVGFSIDKKGYVGTGFDGDDELGDFWEYDQDSDSWSQKANFAGSPRRSAVGFSLNGKGYIGTGYDGSDLKDFWEYNPQNDSWNQIPSLGGSKRKECVAFVIGNTAYVGTGIHNGSYEKDFWALNGDLVGSEEFPWEQMQDLDEDDDYLILRFGAVGFSINNRGYVATGTAGYISNTIWEYVPGSDIWIERTGLEGAPKTDAVAFTLNDRAFVTIGRNGSTYYDDLWEFRPTEEYDEDD